MGTLAQNVKRLTIVGAGLLVLLMTCLPIKGRAEITAYTGAILIDGTRSGVVKEATVLVDGEKIIAAGKGVSIPDGAEIRDVTGKWIVPGLIDAHIHFMTSGRMYTRPAFFDLTDKVSYEEEIAWIREHVPQTLRAFMCSGVTSVLSLGGPSLEYNARELAESMEDAPTVFVGHGVLLPAPKFITERTIPLWDGEPTIKPATSMEMVVPLVEDGVARGADLIKTALDDRGTMMLRAMLWYWDWREWEKGVVEEAAKHGLEVTTHAHGLEYARGAVEAGATSLQHIPADQPVDDAFIELLKNENIIIAPTLGIRQRTFVELITKELQILPVEEKCSVPGVVESWKEPVPPMDALSQKFAREKAIAYANTRTLYQNGVKVAVATDSGMIGLAAGSSMHLELREMHRAGLPADYLVHAATLVSAELVGKEADYGSVEAGKYADFLILGADPHLDIGNLQQIETVVKHGRETPQDTLVPRADRDVR